MRARNIKPGFFKNDVLAETEAIGMVLFAGLWLLADREGRLEDRPLRIKAEVLPYFNCDLEALLEALAVRGFIRRYQVAGGRRFIQVVNWNRHQSPHVKEPPSEIPAPDEHQTSTIQKPDENHSCLGEGSKPAQSENQGIKKSGIKESVNPESEYGPEFEAAWAGYPKRAGSNPKRDAHKAFSARLREVGVTTAMLIAGVERYAAFCRATEKIGTEYVLQAVTFFGPGQRWKQEWELPVGVGNGGGGNGGGHQASPGAARGTAPESRDRSQNGTSPGDDKYLRERERTDAIAAERIARARGPGENPVQ